MSEKTPEKPQGADEPTPRAPAEVSEEPGKDGRGQLNPRGAGAGMGEPNSFEPEEG